MGSEPCVYPEKCQQAELLDHSRRMEVITLSQPSHAIQPPPLTALKGLLQLLGSCCLEHPLPPLGSWQPLQRGARAAPGASGGEVDSHKPETQQMTPTATVLSKVSAMNTQCSYMLLQDSVAQRAPQPCRPSQGRKGPAGQKDKLMAGITHPTCRTGFLLLPHPDYQSPRQSAQRISPSTPSSFGQTMFSGRGKNEKSFTIPTCCS